MPDPARPRLCPRCGNPIASESRACPSCGLGFGGGSTGRLSFGTESDATTEVVAERTRHMQHRMAERLREVVAHCGFPLYGLDERWKGTRAIAGYGGVTTPNRSAPVMRPPRRTISSDPFSMPLPDQITTVSLGHGTWWVASQPYVVVHTRRPGDASALRDQAISLAQHLFHETGRHSEAIRLTIASSDPTAAWDRATLSIDGGSTPCRVLRVDDSCGAIAVAATGSVIGITGRSVDPEEIGIVPAADIEAYLETNPPAPRSSGE